jgi:hypothetical protein
MVKYFCILYEDYITLFYYHNIWQNFCSSWTVKPVSFKCITLTYAQSNVNHARMTNFDQDLWAGHQTRTVTLMVAVRHGKASMCASHVKIKVSASQIYRNGPSLGSMYVPTKPDKGPSTNSRKSFVVSSFGLVKLKGPIHWSICPSLIFNSFLLVLHCRKLEASAGCLVRRVKQLETWLLPVLVHLDLRWPWT